jgi:hypothetical protein
MFYLDDPSGPGASVNVSVVLAAPYDEPAISLSATNKKLTS